MTKEQKEKLVKLAGRIAVAKAELTYEEDQGTDWEEEKKAERNLKRHWRNFNQFLNSL